MCGSGVGQRFGQRIWGFLSLSLFFPSPSSIHFYPLQILWTSQTPSWRSLGQKVIGFQSFRHLPWFWLWDTLSDWVSERELIEYLSSCLPSFDILPESVFSLLVSLESFLFFYPFFCIVPRVYSCYLWEGWSHRCLLGHTRKIPFWKYEQEKKRHIHIHCIYNLADNSGGLMTVWNLYIWWISGQESLIPCTWCWNYKIDQHVVPALIKPLFQSRGKQSFS